MIARHVQHSAVGVGLALLAPGGPARADPVALSLEAMTDIRNRGLSWSNGRPGLEAVVAIPLAGGLSVDFGAATLRNSPRHAGADIGVDAALRYTRRIDAVDLWADVRGQGFLGDTRSGAGTGDYWTLRAGGGYSLGPARLGGHVAWAPPQQAIGGSNLYVAARLSTGVPGTPWSLALSAGHSSGRTDDAIAAARLRPGGDYTDFRFDADYIRGPLFGGVSVTATTIDNDTKQQVPTAPGSDFAPRVLLRLGVRF